MFTKVSVLVPTRHRLQRLATMLESYYATDSGDSELVFRVDDDDPESLEFLSKLPFKVINGPRYGGYANLSTFFNEMAKVAEGDVLMIGNDDMIFRTHGWAQRILEAANRFPDGLFDIGVSTLNETHYPFSIVSKRVVERLGFFWDPTIFWGDIFWRDVMAYFGRCVMVPEVRIDHDWAGFKPDRVFIESDKDITKRDPTYWSGTHRTAVDKAVSSLKELLV